MKIRVLSLWQPWATLWMLDLKRGETRHFKNPFVGFAVIHATQHLDREACSDPVFKAALQSAGFRSSGELPRGAALGTCILEPCKRVEDVRRTASRQELAFGNFEDGRFWWPASHKEPFPEPISVKGHQSVPWLWELPPELEGIFDNVVQPAQAKLFNEVTV